jgi:hypothetical protein
LSFFNYLSRVAKINFEGIFLYYAISGASADRVVLEINPGVAYENLIEMSSKEAGADPWFCVPHLATYDYVRAMAELIATSRVMLGPDVTVYVELSNEVWNTIVWNKQMGKLRSKQSGTFVST